MEMGESGDLRRARVRGHPIERVQEVRKERLRSEPVHLEPEY